ncbi:MAG: glycoside hydrolase family 5 protein [Acetatifactor sp.]
MILHYRFLAMAVALLTAGMLTACGAAELDVTDGLPATSREDVKERAENADSSTTDNSTTGNEESITGGESGTTGGSEEAMPTEMTEEDGHEKAYDAVERMLIGWNLGNSFDATGDWIPKYTNGTNADFETAWGNPVTPDALMTKVKELGFGAVRIPITWRYHFDEEGKIDEVWLSRVQEVVDQALAADLYCIINVHHDTGADGWLRATEANFNENSELFAKLWEQIAERFKDYPDTLLFEGFNEMLDDNAEWNNPTAESVAAINSYNQLFVDTVRATGGNNASRNLICCTYAAAVSDIALNGFAVPEDSAKNHLIAEVHFYTPYEFITEEGVTWTTPISEYTDYVENSIDNAFTSLKNKMMIKGVPVIIGEFATDDKDNTEDRIKWYTHVIEKANELNITCFIWDNGHGFCMGHIDREGDADAFPEIIGVCVDAAE